MKTAAGPRADFERASKLPGEVGHEFQAEGGPAPRLEIAGQPGAGVAHLKADPARGDAQRQPHLAGAAGSKRVLETVGHELVHDEPAGNGLVDHDRGRREVQGASSTALGAAFWARNSWVASCLRYPARSTRPNLPVL